MSGPRSRPRWIWQQSTWPQFVWDSAALTPALSKARRAQGEVAGIARVLDSGLDASTQAEILAVEAMTTSAIEGEKLDLSALRSSIARHLGLPTAGLPRPSRSVDGLVEVLLDATLSHRRPLSIKRLCGWQAALFPTGRSGLHEIRVGKLRGKEPMRIVSGPVGREKIHYEAPPFRGLKSEVQSFVRWFNEPPVALDGLMRAGVAHLWFEILHPFEDGNGRVGRALLDMAMAQDERRSTRLYSLSASFMEKREEYYAALQHASTGNLDITPWLLWFFGQVEAAVHASESIVKRVLLKASFWIKHSRDGFNARQLKALNRMLDSGQEGFQGGMSNKKYAHLTDTSPATAQRDLADMVAKGCLRLTGSGRSTRYEIAYSGRTRTGER